MPFYGGDRSLKFSEVVFSATSTHVLPWHLKYWLLSVHQDLDICHQYSGQYNVQWDGEIKVFTFNCHREPESWLSSEVRQWKCTMGLPCKTNCFSYSLFIGIANIKKNSGQCLRTSRQSGAVFICPSNESRFKVTASMRQITWLSIL